MAKAKSALRRAAALLAALCLAASMTLPVYAGGAEAADAPAIVEQADTIETPAPEGTTTEPQDAEATPTTEPTAEPTAEPIITPEPTAEPTAEPIITPEPTAEPTTEPTITPEITAEPTSTPKPTHTSEPTVTPAPDEDAADDADEVETDDNIDSTNDIAVCAESGNYYNVYFAPPSGWGAPNTVTVRVKRGQNDNAEPTQAMTKTDRNTSDGRPIYTTAIQYVKDSDGFCPYGGFVWIHFERGDNNRWVGMKGPNSTNWITLDSISDKCFDAAGADTGEMNWDEKKWKDLSVISVPYKKYANQQIRFCNKSETELKQVTAQFYIKDDKGTLQTVGDPITFDTVKAGETSAQAITIPNKSCAYISFTVELGKTYYYNFYGEDETDTIDSFTYSSANSCFIYNGADKDPTWGVPGTPPGYARIYFDATFSYMSYENMDEGATCGMPDNSGNLYCTLSGGSSVTTTWRMSRLSDTERIWYVDIPSGYTTCQFSTSGKPSDCHNGTATAQLNIKDAQEKYTEPCFYADSSDDVIVNGGQRDGYWGEKSAIRDVEKGKTKQIVTLDKTNIFTAQKNTKYISTTLYDYYTDFELNGNQRKDYGHDNDYNSNRSYVTFEQFDRALSNYYSDYVANNPGKQIDFPIYTGHFQPYWRTNNADWDHPFGNIANNLALYGWGDRDTQEYRNFMSVNNSTMNVEGNGTFFTSAFQGLVNSKLGADGEPTIYNTGLTEPHFNKAFLTGTNDEHAVLGKVYDDVAFPFTQSNVFRGTNGDPNEAIAKYWYFNSDERSLYLKQDMDDGSYYLEGSTTDDNSRNRGSNNDTYDKDNGCDRGYGFFPFNQDTKGNANRYNYGFGAKLQFQFTLTDDGKVVVGNNGAEVPIRFFFSGDDDVWVFIDGNLALDVGGAHGKASGLLEFGQTADGEANTVTPYVSSNKAGGETYTTGVDKTVYFNDKQVKFTKQGTTTTLPKGTTHTLTMYYMERGMWESNMAVAYNFPDHNELQVEKKVDVSQVDDAFKHFFTDQSLKLFTVNIRNQATHYAAVEANTGDAPADVTLPADFTACYYNSGSYQDTNDNYLKKGETPTKEESDTQYAGQTVLWYAQDNDIGSNFREKRLGSIRIPDGELLNVSQMDTLTFQVYAKGGNNVGSLSTNFLYLQLVDKNNKVMGCLNRTTYLNDKTSNNPAMRNDTWVTVRVSMEKLKAEKEDDFDLTQVKEIRIGDDYQRTVYFRNFTFTAKRTINASFGFTVKQEAIPDYGSAQAKALKPAYGALFTSNEGNGTQMVDANGQFELGDGEIVTFSDQFRRGSYISLEEVANDDLYDTSWEVYENGQLVNALNDGTTVTNDSSVPLPLRKDNDNRPEDGRTEKVSTNEGEQAGNKYDGEKPDANTLVFRSYTAPDNADPFTKLKVRFINKIKVGTLTIEKKEPEGETTLKDRGTTYKFTIHFSNIGGIGLGGNGVTMTRELKVGESTTIPGIPIGTRFTVTEEAAEGSNLQSVTVDATDGEIIDNAARGTITTDNPAVTATFTNTARTLIDLNVIKLWKDAEGNDLAVADMPAAIWIKLERRHEGGTDTEWSTTREYPNPIQLKRNGMSGQWTCKFEHLDQYDVTKDPQVEYEYRITESGTEGGTYVPTGGQMTAADGFTYTLTQQTEGNTITLKNTREKPKYQLNITKQGIDGENEPVLLKGVQFTLEVKGTDESYTAVTGSPQTTDGNGKCSFTGLEPGSYRLTEVKTADSYTLLAEPIEFVLTDKGECTHDNAKFGTVKRDEKSGVYTIALTINNRKGLTLPHTGADAPSLWVLIGLPLLVAGLLVLVFRYNRKGGKRS